MGYKTIVDIALKAPKYSKDTMALFSKVSRSYYEKGLKKTVKEYGQKTVDKWQKFKSDMFKTGKEGQVSGTDPRGTVGGKVSRTPTKGGHIYKKGGPVIAKKVSKKKKASKKKKPRGVGAAKRGW
jgi:hypothetical protein|tara:strand:- start:543 stop:917 length:375 start_codon:yes stop_codon:yes gene_type:complete